MDPAQTLFLRAIHDAAWCPVGATCTHSYLSSLCDAHTLGTLVLHSTPGDRISPGCLWKVGTPSSLTDTDLIRTALHLCRSLRFANLDQDKQEPLCGQVLDGSARPSSESHNGTAHVCHDAAQEARLRSQRETAGLLQPRPDTDGLPQRASRDRPTDSWIPCGKDVVPEVWDFAFTSCLRPAARNLGPTTSPTQNLGEYETLKRTFYGIRFVQVVFEGRAGGCGDSARKLGYWEFSSSCRLLGPRSKRDQSGTGSAHLFATSLWLRGCHSPSCPPGCLEGRSLLPPPSPSSLLPSAQDRCPQFLCFTTTKYRRISQEDRAESVTCSRTMGKIWSNDDTLHTRTCSKMTLLQRHFKISLNCKRSPKALVERRE